MPRFTTHQLDDRHTFSVGRLPENLIYTRAKFDELWNMHPPEYLEIKMHGKVVNTPRWQQAYGMQYVYSGQINDALPTPPILQPLLDWSKRTVDPRLNGLLLNWYDGQKGHYIGKHRDSTANMHHGCPIVTISFGEERIFRIKPHKKNEPVRDFPTTEGSVFVMPYKTNEVCTHEVPKSSRATGKRISVTVRGFVR